MLLSYARNKSKMSTCPLLCYVVIQGYKHLMADFGRPCLLLFWAVTALM